MKSTNLLLIATILVFSLPLSGCTTYGKCPAPPKLEQPQYAIYDLPDNSSNSDKAKAIAMSWHQCVSYSNQCENVLEKYK